jgi:enoyl-CoA hydratase/carnithine racemase
MADSEPGIEIARSSHESEVTVVDEGLIRVIVLNRPGRLNAFTDVGYRMLGDALRVADAAPDVHVVLIEGAGRGFSSGVDLDALRDGDRRASGLEMAAARSLSMDLRPPKVRRTS